MRVITVANQKGGVAKTTTVSALTHALRARGYSVAALDLDPSGTLDLLVQDARRLTARELRRALRDLRGRDLVILDTPPALGATTRAALDAADGILVPILPELLAVRALTNLLTVLDREKLLGLVLTFWRPYTKHHQEVAGKLEELGLPILGRIPFSVSVSDAGLKGQPLMEYGPARARGVSAAYELLTEVLAIWSEEN